MAVRKYIIGSIIAGGIGLAALGGYGYSYASTLNKEMDTYVLPHTTFEGISLDGKTKDEVRTIINQKVEQYNQQKITYTLNEQNNTYNWKDLGVGYNGTEIVDQLFKEQQGSLLDRYQLRKKAQSVGLNRQYHVQPYLDTAKYDAFIKDKYNDLLTKPEDASLSVTGTNISITSSKDGSKVDKGQLSTLTAEAIKNSSTNIALPVVTVKPEHTTEDMQNMGIQTVIGEFHTSTGGRDGSQVFNVSRAANSLSGVLLAPDAEFSFNDRVGITDADHGYQSAPIYVDGKVEQSAGGGVCQVSSTLYGAVLRADLSIVSRSNHSLPVHYVPLGQDATVADYGPDFKFKNNTGHYIYIQAMVENNDAVVRIFGTSTGKNVQVSSQVTSETNDKIYVDTFKTVTQNGVVISNGRISKSTYKKA
ncbi:VanW family protein [Ectobacillus sp. sgz5001026]|uniref:VanW family protein n=1 Tax=Ectobacillus sp. sgz5001026 TaxID=3242473 RepID=UPI0036D29A02